MSSTYALGIDLGTTNSAIAYYKNNEPQIILNKFGSRVTPSYVTFDWCAKSKSPIPSVGIFAQQRVEIGLGASAFDAKRFIGQTFETLDQFHQVKYPFEILFDSNKNAIFEIPLQNKKAVHRTPEDISGLVLEELLTAAEDHLHNHFTPKAVVAVPAYFTSAQRQATKAAANLAGIQLLGLLNEPTAAAIHYIFNASEKYSSLEPKVLLVYDLGGGTFDTSIIQINSSQQIVVKAIDGDTALGGAHFDENLMKRVIAEIKTQFNEDVLENKAQKARRFLRRLRFICVKVKETLSTRKDDEIDVSSLVECEDDDDAVLRITRQVFEEENKELFEKTLDIVRKCLDQSELSQHQIDEVLLVGGSTRIPRIHAMLEDFFGEGKIRKTVNPDEAVALGAAIYAASLHDKSKLGCFELVNVLSFSLGTDVSGNKMSFILPRNTSLPASKKKTFRTIYDNQTHFLIRIFEGEDRMCKNNKYLGEFVIDGLQEAAKGQIKLQLTFHVDIHGKLNVSAIEKFHKLSKQLTIALNC